MIASTGNSSPSHYYFWDECDHTSGSIVSFQILTVTGFTETFFGFPLNIWLVQHIIRKRSKHSGILPANFFPLYIAINQLCSYFYLPLIISNHFLWRSNTVFFISVLLNSTILVMKPLLFSLVCVERYLAVVRPLDYLRFKERHYRWGCLAVSWCIYLLITVIYSRTYSSFALCSLFLLALVIDTFLSLSILKALKKIPPGNGKMAMEVKKKNKNKERKQGQSSRKEEDVEKTSRDEPKQKGEMNSMKRKAFNTIIIIQVVLTFNYLPFIITWVLSGTVTNATNKCVYQIFSMAAAAFCSYLQPLLYLHRLGRLTFLTKHIERFISACLCVIE